MYATQRRGDGGPRPVEIFIEGVETVSHLRSRTNGQLVVLDHQQTCSSSRRRLQHDEIITAEESLVLRPPFGPIYAKVAAKSNSIISNRENLGLWCLSNDQTMKLFGK